MTIPNWNELNWYHYLALGDVVVILALLLYFATRSRAKIPAIFMGILGGAGVGAALGAGLVIALVALGVQVDRDYANTPDDRVMGPGGGPGKGKGGPGMGKGKGGPGMGKGKNAPGKGGFGMPGGGGRGQSPQTQLATLVTKLDLLTHKPLAVTLDGEQKKKVREALQKLDTAKDLSNDDARAKVEDLRKILNEEQRKTLEAAGYRWPAPAAPPTPGNPPVLEANPNPFSEGENSQHLKSLLSESK